MAAQAVPLSSEIIRDIQIVDFSHYVACRQLWSILTLPDITPAALEVLRQGLARLGLASQLLPQLEHLAARRSQLEEKLRMALAHYQTKVDPMVEAIFHWHYELGMGVALASGAPLIRPAREVESALLRHYGLEGLASNLEQLQQYFLTPAPGENWLHFWTRCLQNGQPGPVFQGKMAPSDEILCQGLREGYPEAREYFEREVGDYQVFWLLCLARGGHAAWLAEALEWFHFEQQDYLSSREAEELAWSAVDSGDLETVKVAISTDEAEELSLLGLVSRAAGAGRYDLLRFLLMEGPGMGFSDSLTTDNLYDVYEDLPDLELQDIRLLLLERMDSLATQSQQRLQVDQIRQLVLKDL